jgi:serine/threonine protein kinase
MEFVEGTNLQSRLLAGPLPLGQVLRIGGELADALVHAHHRGVVHRDVKPSNIILDQEDRPHLTDFGIALVAGTPRLTSVNEILGTPAYLAPEQLSDTEIGPPADVYALGLVLLECLSGQLEYASGSSLEVALARLSRPPRIPADLPPGLADLLTAMTATEALDRPTAETCALRLQAEAGDTMQDVGPPVSMAPVAREPVASQPDEDRTEYVPVGLVTAAHGSPRRRLLAASVAGIAAVVAAALMLLLNTPQRSAGGSQAAAVGHTSSGHSTAGSTDPARAARGSGTLGSATRGPETHGSAPTAGMLVVNEHPAPGATPHASASFTARPSHSTPATTSATTAPRQTTVPTQPPPTTSSEPPPTTASTSTEPPSTNGIPGN